MAIALANSRDGEGLTAKASLGAVASIAHHKHQMFEHSRAGQTRGDCCAQAPVAPYELQDRSNHAVPVRAVFLRDDLPNLLKTCRGLRAPGLSRIQIGSILPLPQLRVRAVTGCASLFHSSRNRACKPFARRQSLPTQQILQSIADRRHVPGFLSSSVVFAGFNTSEATDGRVPNTAGAFQKTEGELPNVGS